MSKSLRRVVADARDRGIVIEPVRLDEGTLTAEAAARACGVVVDRIVKSVVLRAADADVPLAAPHFLFLTAGNNRVSLTRASALAGRPLVSGDGASIRAHTGFAIGGVSPFGHVRPILAWLDPHVLDFATVWAAAGTPHHVFEIAPTALVEALAPTVADFTE